MHGRRPPLAGYNTNIRHGGRLFHLQTEDLGHARATVESVLFVDGGRIIDACRAPYGAEAPSEGEVRGQMQAQHKRILLALRDGAYDDAAGQHDESP